ncbi:fluoride efflux transporter FluC [Kineococcus sp. SYSU DK002]|uniref:fluoride efflux transporter FluC n=1 Tax=Kineococcus sp. SYSU DK002 TaxID=3383123 RepID=UPI003D7EC854
MTVPHRDPRLVLLVAAGGAAGTLLRHLVSQALPAPGGFPAATLAVNVAGSFVLGLLLEALARRGPETPAALRWRLGLGTGFCGGLTTWSSFAVELDRLVSTGAPATALAHAATSLTAGLLAAAAGVALGALTARLTARRSR